MAVLAIVILLDPLRAAAGQAPPAKPAPAAKPASTAPSKPLDAAQGAPAANIPARAKAWTPTRTPWGDPDLQGVWNDATSTPLQRPSTRAGKDVLTDEEANEFQQELAFDLTRDRRDGGPEVDVNRAYNDHWMDARRLKITADRRTSLIVDPADGRIPPLVPLSPERQQARTARAAANARFNAGMPYSPEEMSLPVRCIIRTDSPPYLPTIYNNNFQIYQSPGYVVIAPEMIHSARIIPLDSRPHLDSRIRVWNGDSRAHWEGDTLAIDTTNFSPKSEFMGAHDTLHLTERLTRVGPEILNYEFTVNDPTMWTAPWTAMIPLKHKNEAIYEYACHEGNEAIPNMLRGHRYEERQLAGTKSQRK
jgi:hypothetical protein